MLTIIDQTGKLCFETKSISLNYDNIVAVNEATKEKITVFISNDNKKAKNIFEMMITRIVKIKMGTPVIPVFDIRDVAK